MTAIMALGAFLPGLFGKTLPAKYTKLLGTALLILGALLLFGLGKLAYDASVIAKHEAEQRAEIARKQLEADRAASCSWVRSTSHRARTYGAASLRPTTAVLVRVSLAWVHRASHLHRPRWRKVCTACGQVRITSRLRCRAHS